MSVQLLVPGQCQSTALLVIILLRESGVQILGVAEIQRNRLESGHQEAKDQLGTSFNMNLNERKNERRKERKKELTRTEMIEN